MRIVKDLFAIPDEENFILYSPSSRSLMKVNQSAINTLDLIGKGDIDLNSLDGEFIRQLQNSGLLLKTGRVEPELRFQKKAGAFDPRALTLFLSTRCNLACSYCYADGGNRPKVLGQDIAFAALNWFAWHQKEMGREDFTVIFHGGGEVTTAKRLLSGCVEEARRLAEKYGLRTSFQAGLNGVMGQKTLKWVVENLDGATLSVDGLPEIHDKNRPLRNGRGSFDQVAATLDYMDEHDFRYGIRTTVTESSLKHLVRSVDFMASRFKSRVIQLEPVFPTGRGMENHQGGVDPTEFVEKFRRAVPLAMRHGTTLKYSGARFQTVTNRFCGVGDDSMAVNTEGKLTACYEVGDSEDPRSDRFLFGHVDVLTGKLVIDEKRLEKLRRLTVENKPHCQKCFCKWHCAGDCAAKLALYGDPLDPSNSPRCRVNRELTLDQMRRQLVDGRRTSYETATRVVKNHPPAPFQTRKSHE